MNDGDWICSDPSCGNINFARRASCYRCNKERPEVVKPSKKKLGTEIGKSAAEKSRGLFNADDWQCNKCANVNWARRQTCNVCNAPKFGEVEARTGYGGGYNERGVVEYRRRENSDDEYDEFGRKKRKRKSDSQEQVGITEGAVPKKLPSTMLPTETKMDHIPVPASKMTNPNSVKHTKGSLSDGSVCDLPPLTKVGFRRNQLQTQTNYHRQDHMLPNYKPNGNQTRKRFVSSGDRDQAASSGYETGSKRSKRSSTESSCNRPNNPVMENRVSSTNNDSVVYKFAGTTPADNFQVRYTIEERVKAAAFAIVYNNCKISTDKFESLYDKPAPDFKTIFAWRQRLLSTGCLIDSHVDTKKDVTEKSANNILSLVNSATNKLPNNCKGTNIKKVPNPDEIPIDSDSDHSLNNNRSISAETLLIPGLEKETRALTSSGSTVEGQGSQRCGRSHSASTHQRTRSSSCASQDSNYPDSDSEKQDKQIISKNSCNKIQPKMSLRDSDSDSFSYNSEDENFLSRVYGDGKKIRRKFRRRSTVSDTKTASYTSNIETPTFQGYTSGIKLNQPVIEPVNMYTSNLSIINVREHDSKLVDTDGGSIEYVPTKVGSTAQKNYQEFKDNVRRKGYWAKGNAATFRRNVNNISRPLPVQKPTNYNNNAWSTNVNKQLDKNIVQSSPFKHVDHVTKNVYPRDTKCYNSQVQKTGIDDFSKDLDYVAPNEQYLPFDKSIPSKQMKIASSHEDSDRIFAAVQSSSNQKNKSIMDIFETNDTVKKSPVKSTETNYDSILKRYESQWDEDDDELYKDSFDTGLGNKVCTPPHVNVTSMQSPLSNMYTSTDRESQSTTPNKSFDVFKEKQEMLLGLLKEIQVNKCQQLGELISPLKPCDPTVSESDIDDNSSFQNVAPSQNGIDRNVNPTTTANREPSVEIIQTPNKHDIFRDLNRTKSKETNSPSNCIEILESVTIQPSHNYFVPMQKPNENCSNPPAPVEITPTVLKSNIEPVKENSHEQTPIVPQLDLSNVLAGINTNDLLLAIQNLQQLKQNPSVETENAINEHNSSSEEVQHVETINLINDEEWERETTRDESIERQLEQLDGNTGSTPFLSDIFDPGPVIIPPNVAKNLNLNLQCLNSDKNEKTKHINENAPVIGNFKSFALPKPILLNRLKLTVKPSDKNPKKPEGKKRLRKKNKSQNQQNEDGVEQDEDDDEESGDEADLSKYDLWGSDEEKGTSSKKDDAEKPKATENVKENPPQVEDNNGRNVSPDANSNRRSRSSSSSSSTSSSSSSSQSSSQAPKNKFDDFNLNSERESSPKPDKSRSRSPRSRSGGPTRRKSRDSRSAGETRSHDSSRDKERSRDRDRRDKTRPRDKERRSYTRDGAGHYGARGRHR